jgi:hypothetical protein
MRLKVSFGSLRMAPSVHGSHASPMPSPSSCAGFGAPTQSSSSSQTPSSSPSGHGSVDVVVVVLVVVVDPGALVLVVDVLGGEVEVVELVLVLDEVVVVGVAFTIVKLSNSTSLRSMVSTVRVVSFTRRTAVYE